MKIQYINNKSETEFKKNYEEHEFTFNNFSAPFSPDDFDINIIDLNNIWNNSKSEEILEIDIINNIHSLKEMMSNSQKSKFILICPYDQEYNYTTWSLRARFSKTKRLKDDICEFSRIIDFLLPDENNVDLTYERTRTLINDEKTLMADFYFEDFTEILTKSSTDKVTTIKIDDRFYITTLNFRLSYNDFAENIINFLEKIKLIKNESPVPDWVFSENLFDDLEQIQKIETQEKIISKAKLEIEKSQEILNKNLYYKSILYSNGNELVKVVFEILEDILECDLSSFNDEKHEDFLIKKSNVTFIGEIKGVNGSVKSANISQLDVHYNGYLDKLQEENKNENVKALLIINPNRSRPIKEREKIHQNQLDLAIRNGSLIIQTYDLLKIFEAFKQNKISSEDIENIFSDKIGILNFEEVLK
ncbi:hypothetical protein [Fusobacterium sp.]|uniref:hypothetical protein n=1 Tax=Fusobacterium sp. TaxID=68766 RepID=UPI00262A6062|nr:hypothetical protein [Fusobacterium sp.]